MRILSFRIAFETRKLCPFLDKSTIMILLTLGILRSKGDFQAPTVWIECGDAFGKSATSFAAIFDKTLRDGWRQAPIYRVR